MACSAPWRSASGTTLVAPSSDRRLVTDPTVPDVLRSQAGAIQPVGAITSSWGSTGRSLINAKRNASFSRRGSICRKARAWSLNQSSAIGVTCARMIGLIMSRANASVLTTEPGPTIDCICSSSNCMAHRLAACSAAIAVSAAASRHSRTAARLAPTSRCGMFIGSDGRDHVAVSIRNVRSCMLIKASAWVTRAVSRGKRIRFDARARASSFCSGGLWWIAARPLSGGVRERADVRSGSRAGISNAFGWWITARPLSSATSTLAAVRSDHL